MYTHFPRSWDIKERNSNERVFYCFSCSQSYCIQINYDKHYTLNSFNSSDLLRPLKLSSSGVLLYFLHLHIHCRSQWPCGLRRGSTAARLLELWVRIPPRAWMSVSWDCCVFSGRGLCDGLITRPE
jgi:hypothetical protein